MARGARHPKCPRPNPGEYSYTTLSTSAKNGETLERDEPGRDEPIALTQPLK